MKDDLIARLTGLADGEHDDLKVGYEARDEIIHLRAELTEARKPDCRTCDVYDQCYDGSRPPCDSGTGHVSDHTVRLYELMAGLEEAK